MPRKRRWPPTVENHRGRARARGRDGSYTYFGPFGSTEANAAYADWLLGQAEPGRRCERFVTVGSVCRQWLSENSSRLIQPELEHYEITIRALDRMFGELPANEFDAGKLSLWRSRIVSGDWLTPDEVQWRIAKKVPLTLSRGTANRRTTRVKTIWRWAELHNLVPHGSYANLAALPPLDGRSGVPKGEGMGASKLADVLQVAACAVPPAGDMLLVQWWCGMRSGEVRIMRTVDLDRKNSVWFYYPSQHKNQWRGEERVVMVPPEAQILLAPFLNESSPNAFLFTTQSGAIYSSDYYSQSISRASKKAGVKVRPYEGRHAAKDRILKEHGPEIARIFLGHKSLDTQQYYGEKDIRAALDAFLKDAD